MLDFLPMIICLSKEVSGADVVNAAGSRTGLPVDISGLGSDWEIVLHILLLTPEKRALFHIFDSQDGFATTLPGPVFNPYGEVKSIAPRKFVALSRDYPSLRFGQQGAQLRLDLMALDEGAHVRYSAFVRTP